jgi:AhpD family alkylhydroperoxidase
MVPNLYATFAQSPAVLNGFLALSDALSKGLLTPRQREIVALATAQANSCHYCLSAHTLLGKGAGLSPDAIRAARQGKADNAPDNAVASFAARDDGGVCCSRPGPCAAPAASARGRRVAA